MNQSSAEYFLRKYSNRGSLSQTSFSKTGYSSNFESPASDKGRTWIRKNDENARLEQQTKDLQKNSWEMENQLNEIQLMMKKIEGQNIYLQAQVEFYQGEVRTLNDLINQERNSFQTQVWRLKNQLELVKDYTNDLKRPLENSNQELDENHRLRLTLQQMQAKENQLLEEISRLLTRLEQEKVEWLEKIVRKEKEFSATVKEKDLEIERLRQENEGIRCKALEQEFSIKLLKQDLDDLKLVAVENRTKPKKAKKYFKVSLSPQNHEKKNLKPAQRPASDLNESKTGSIYHKSCKNPNFSGAVSKDFGRTEVFLTNHEKKQEKALKDQVKNLEKQIVQVNQDYRRLINSTTPGSEGYFKYKKDVDKLARALEEKSKTLFDVKRRYSSLIRSYSLSSD